MSTNDKPVLYALRFNVDSSRVKLALALKGIDYEYHLVDVEGGEDHSDDFRRLNPLGHIPALSLPHSQALTQSISIIEYIEEKWPHPPFLLPHDSLMRARAREIAYLTISDQVIERLFNSLEALLSHCAGKYCVGDEVSLADCCVLPLISISHCSLSDGMLCHWPILARISRNLNELEAVKLSIVDENNG